MAEKRGTLAVISGTRTVVEMSANGTDWTEIPGLDNVDAPSGTRESTTINAFEGKRTITGDSDVPNITLNVVAVSPHMPVMLDIVKAFNENTNRHWRITTREDVLFQGSATNTAAIAITGVVTFAGTKPDFNDEYARGEVIVIGGTAYPIVSIDQSNATPPVATVTVAKPSAAVTAATYKIVIPSLRYGPFIGKVTEGGSFTLGQDSGTPLSSSIVITPTTTVNQPTIVV